MGIERSYLNIEMSIYDKPTANVLNGEKLKAFPLRSETRQGCPLSLLLFNIVLKSQLCQSEQKRNKRNPDGKRRSEASLIADDMILHTQNPKDSIRKLLELISEICKVTGYKIHTQKSLTFLYTNNEKSEREIKEPFPFTIATKSIKYLGINLHKETEGLYNRKS